MNLLMQYILYIKKYPERLKIFEESKNSEFKEEPEEPENLKNIIIILMKMVLVYLLIQNMIPMVLI